MSVVLKGVNPSIEAAGSDQFSHREETQEAARKAKKERDEFLAILKNIFNPSFGENVVSFNIEPVKRAIEATTKIFPQFAAAENKIIFSNAQAQISIEQKRIAFEAVEAKQNTKPTFTAESAYAMALLASTNPLMIKQGIKLRGTPEAQALLRSAIDKVNEQLPEGQKLKIRGENIMPAMNVAAKPENDNTAKTVKPDVTAPAEEAKKDKGLTRRWFLTGAAAAVTAAAVGVTPDEANAARSKHFYDQKMKSGLYNPDMTLKSETKKKSAKKEKPAARKKREKVEKKSARKKKETAAERRAREKAERAEARKKEAQRLKSDKAARRAEEKAKRKQEAARQREEAKARKAEDKKAAAQQKKAEAQQQKGEASTVRTGSVRIVCTHTGASTTLDFNNPRSCQGAFNHVTKDWRQGVTHNMAPGLITFLGRITKDLRARGTRVTQINIVAGFRTEETNNMLIAASKKRNGGKSGVARNSWHKKGMALDFQIAGVGNAKLSNAAKRAGAWSYSAGDFVHMDTRGAYTV